MEDTRVHSFDSRPDVPLENLIVFSSRPDVLLEDFGRLERPAFPPQQHTTVPSETVQRKSKLREWCESLAGTIVFVLVFTTFVAQATQVPTESMKPSILVGDHFFLDKVAFPGNFPESVRQYLPQREVERGDIIAFKSPVDTKTPFVKRVIGVPGDILEIRKKMVYVNGSLSAEPYKIHVDSGVYEHDAWTPEELSVRDNYGPLTVPPAHFFVMGDNRDNSQDSRYWGFVSREAIIGKPLFIYWSYESDPYIPTEQSFAEWVQGYVSIATHFFGRTRWFRIGTMVE